MVGQDLELIYTHQHQKFTLNCGHPYLPDALLEFAAFCSFPPIKIKILYSITDVYNGRVGAGVEVG